MFVCDKELDKERIKNIVFDGDKTGFDIIDLKNLYFQSEEGRCLSNGLDVNATISIQFACGSI